ncbi:uncharacterized protein LOC131691819 isoform X2 [Topomyia yanbarensis]|uniref:uncharacterized protein LOC131691819 isoform X2 n=1 Tax=Topomyia yanbarensis TaxID=2498891 RepID=UPI00273C05D2|nr:uncharacterized protein LOC131691819 isoform X2 [Topomyia yanbarensis]
MWHLKYFVIKAVLILLARPGFAQFKILGISSGRSKSDEGEVALVQIRPLQLNTTEPVESRSFGDAPISIAISTSKPAATTTAETIEAQTSKIIKLQIMDSSVARNISSREGKLQYSNHLTDNDIINIAPLRPTPVPANPTSTHRRRAIGSIKLTGDSELFYIHTPSSPAPFKKHYQTKDNDITDFVLQRYKRRKYKTKCRCERIWNCPRIQLSVARCDPDYFMCCF